MFTVRPATAAWLPHALEVSADRYGPIGVAFTYLAWLYIASFCFLATAVVGQVIATDRGGLGTNRGEIRPVPGLPTAKEAESAGPETPRPEVTQPRPSKRGVMKSRGSEHESFTDFCTSPDLRPDRVGFDDPSQP